MNIAMACVCGATATARAKRDTWRFGHAHRWCGSDELVARRRLKGGKPQPPPPRAGHGAALTSSPPVDDGKVGPEQLAAVTADARADDASG